MSTSILCPFLAPLVAKAAAEHREEGWTVTVHEITKHQAAVVLVQPNELAETLVEWFELIDGRTFMNYCVQPQRDDV